MANIKGPSVSVDGDSSGALKALSDVDKALDKQRASFDKLRRSMDPAYAASQKYREVQQQLAQAVESGAIRQAAANKVLEQARVKLFGLSQVAKDSERANKRVTKSNEDLAKSYQSIRSSLDPVYANAKRYQQTQEQLNAALEKGVINQTQYEKTLMMAEQRFITNGQTAREMAKGIRSTALHTGNLAAQFNDIGVMMASGQSPLLLALQQGTQINQVFAAMGGSPMDNLRALGNGIKSMINPMSLATIGTIALVAAVGQLVTRMTGATEEAKKLAEQIQQVKKAQDEMIEATRAGALGISKEELVLTDQIARARERAAEAEIEMSRVLGLNLSARSGIFEKAQRELIASREHLESVRDQLNEYRSIQNAKERTLEAAREMADAERLLGEQLQEAARAAAMLKVEMQQARDASMEAAREFMTVQRLRSRFAGEEAVMGQDVLQPGRGDPPPPKIRTGTRSSGRGGGELETLIESLQTERETIEQWRMEGMELLQEAKDQELEIIGGYNEAKLRLEEEYQRRLSGIQQAGNKNSLESIVGGGAAILRAMGQNNEKALKVSQVFAAAEALISTYKGAAKELEKGTLGFATAAAVIAKGIAFVNAIRSVNSSTGSAGASSAGAGAGGGTAAAAPETRTVSEIRFIGSMGPDPQQIVDIINEEYRNGNYVRAVVG